VADTKVVTITTTQPRVNEVICTSIDENSSYEDVSYIWYVDDVPVADCRESSYIPSASDYEHWIKVEAYEAGTLIGTDRLYFSKLPVVYIETEDGEAVTQKEYKDASLEITGNDEYPEQYSGKTQIKLRGNISAGYPQKPYKLKLDTSTDLFGFGKSKHWVLISNYMDQCGLRNIMGSNLSKELGLANMSMTWVDVVLNNSYAGMYMLCEHIRIDDDRVEIYNWEDETENVAKAIYIAHKDVLSKDDRDAIEDQLCEDFSWISTGTVTYQEVTYNIADYYKVSTNISGGYLFELSEEYDEVSKFMTSRGLKVMVNSPEYLYTNDAMMKYVEEYWQKYEDALTSVTGYNSEGQHYSELADFDSMVSYWLTMEIMGNDDSQYKSRYAYKNVDQILTFGPVWDFDFGCGSYAVGTSATGWKSTIGTLWKDFVDDPYFQVKACEKYWEIRPYLQSLVEDGGYIDQSVAYLSEAGAASDVTYPQEEFIGCDRRTFSTDAEIFKTYMQNRLLWLDTQFATQESITQSLYTTPCSHPYTKSDNMAISLLNTRTDDRSENAPADGLLLEQSDLIMKISTTDDTICKFGIFVNGIKCTETEQPGKVTIPANCLTEEMGTKNIISVIGWNNAGEAVATNYVSVIQVTGKKIILAEFDFASGVEGEELSETVAATSGEFSENCVLTASMDGEENKKLKFSAAEYTDGDMENTIVPILEPSSSETWTANACFTVQCSTVGFTDIVFSASLGATKKGAKDFRLQYSLDGTAFADIPDSDVSLKKNKTMTALYTEFKLPEECADQNVVYIRIKLASNETVGGSTYVYDTDTGVGSTSGEIAINHISVVGRKIGEGCSLGHSFTNYVSDGNATCVTDGTKTAVCDNCDATDTVADEGSALGHHFTNYVSDGNATCVTDGTKTAVCDNCDATDTVADEGSALGHHFTNYVSDGNATYETDGTKTAMCDRCNVTDTVEDTGSILPEVPEESEVIEPSTPENTVETNTQGNVTNPVEIAPSVSGSSLTAAAGEAASVTRKTEIENVAKNTSAVVTTVIAGDGTISSAKATITRIIGDSNKLSITGSIIKQVVEAAGTDSVDVTVIAKDSDGKNKYKIKVNTADMTAGSKLVAYRLNTKTGEYIMVNDKRYTVSDKGTVSITMTKNRTYELVTEKKAKAINKVIRATVKPAKSKITVKAGKTAVIKQSAKLNTANVKSVTYTSTKKSVATVGKKGKVTAKKAGTTTIKIKVTLKNGSSKTVKTVVKVTSKS
jgi:hypothetical protein